MPIGVPKTQLAWKEVYDAYFWDRLEAAYEGATSLGTGAGAGGARFYRQIEGEYLTRKQSAQIDVNAWLSFEFVEAEVAHATELPGPILQACDNIAHRLSWDHTAKILISVLTEEANAPWAVGRYGYFVDKHPYDKICIPLNATLDPARLYEVIVHEYAHAIVLNLASGHAPRWLDEMIAMIAQGGPERGIGAKFASGEVKWLKPAALNVQYVAEREGQSGIGVFHAYQQSACIGAYLVDLKGEAALGDLLRAFSDNSVVKELAMLAINLAPADEALKQVYGFGEKELFKRTLDWLKGR
jgi:hypothetical protein